MKNCCLRDGKTEQLRRGSVTGEHVATYLNLKKTINESGVVTLAHRHGSNVLCFQCAEELARWLGDKNRHLR